jgi:hypothetical protein
MEHDSYGTSRNLKWLVAQDVGWSVLGMTYKAENMLLRRRSLIVKIRN